jgi:hypothetical protein
VQPGVNQSSLWWLARASKDEKDSNDELAQWVNRVAVARESDQIQQRWRNVVFFRHMFARPNSAQFAYAMARRPTSQINWFSSFAFTPPTYNSIASCGDIYVNRLFKNHSFLEVSADRGDYEMHKTGLAVEDWLDGALEESGLWSQWSEMGLDALTYGTGWFKFYIDEHEEMRVARKHTDELLFANPDEDVQDEVIERVWAKRDEALAAYGDTVARRDAINKATAFPAFFIGTGLDCSNVIPLLQAYKCSHGPKRKNKGRVALVVGNVTLSDEEYDESTLPFENFQFHEIGGVHGQGLAEILLTLDEEFNTELSFIVENIHRCGFPKWLVEENSGVNPDALGDLSAGIVNYLVTKPDQIAPPPNSPQMFENLDRILALIMKRAHLSENAVQSQTPAGLKSGTALEKWQSIDDANFGEIGGRLEAFLVRCGYQLIRLGKKLKPSVTLSGSRRQVIDWVELKIKKGKPKYLRAFPMSRLSQLPAGKQEELDEMLREGDIDKRQHTRASQLQDINGLLSILTAPQDSVESKIDQIVESGDYQPPSPFIDLDHAIEYAGARYLIEEDNGAPRDVLDLILQWVAAAEEQRDERDAKAAAKAAPAGPQPGFGDVTPPGQVPVAPAAPLQNPQNAIT